MANPANLDPSVWVDRYGDYLFRYAMLRLRDRPAAGRLAATLEAPGESFGETLSEEARERIRESMKNP